MQQATRTFRSKEEAQNFAKTVRGFIEGPFIDEKLEASYIVFFKSNH
jgi:hypothetical protein